MNLITYVQEKMVEILPEILSTYAGEIGDVDLSAMEQQVKQMSHEVGNEVLKSWLEMQDGKYPAAAQPCPHCTAQADYVRRRSGLAITLLGRVYYRRSYYCCAVCGHGHYPLDHRLKIKSGEMSDEVVKCAALVGIETGFETSRDRLARLSLLELSPNSIRKASQLMGATVMRQDAALLAHSQSDEAQHAHRREPEKPQRLYGSMDGFMVLVEDGWHEMKAGAWWTTRTTRQGELKADNIHYYVDYLPAAEFANLVWATGFEQSADQALELVFVADGAAWIWRIVEQHYPQAIQIVDWYHASAYLAPIAAAAFNDELAARRWLDQQTDALWEGRLSQVFHACRLLVECAPDAVHTALTYFARNRHRMRYDKFRQMGLQIGSGTMESGCKQLGLGRLKIAGAQWSADGARLVAKARAAYLSGQWDEINPSTQPLPHIA